MTNQTDIKKLAEQMAGSMKSFDDIKDFQKQLMQSFIDTALEAEMEEHLGYPKHEKVDKPNKRNGIALLRKAIKPTLEYRSFYRTRFWMF
uniref:transposase n=1 Tax=Psychrobacter fulvigenes TaxID=533323 RepID=UPI0038793DDE